MDATAFSIVGESPTGITSNNREPNVDCSIRTSTTDIQPRKTFQVQSRLSRFFARMNRLMSFYNSKTLVVPTKSRLDTRPSHLRISEWQKWPQDRTLSQYVRCVSSPCFSFVCSILIRHVRELPPLLPHTIK